MDKNKLSDEQLMMHVIEGDVAAYKVLYRRYNQSVMGLAYKILGESSAAEEAMQETFWRIWENAASFNRRRGSFSNWMFGIARNLSIDILRRRQKIRMQSLPDAHHERAESSPHLKADHDVAETAWLSLRHEQVHVALAELPSEQRDVVNWIYFQGKTRREIAREHNIPFGTINTRAKLALEKIKRSLQAQGFED